MLTSGTKHSAGAVDTAADPGIQQGTALRVIYVALVAGVALAAAVARFVVHLTPIATGATLRWLWVGVAAASVLAIYYLRPRLTPPEAARRRVEAAALIVWALAEGQALVGIVAYLVGGDAVLLWAGLALFAFLVARYHPGTFDAGSPS